MIKNREVVPFVNITKWSQIFIREFSAADKYKINRRKHLKTKLRYIWSWESN